MKKIVLLLLALSFSAFAANKPFLIQGKLPHLTGIVKSHWNDEELELTKKQKDKLLVIRKETVSGVKALAKQIFTLESEIVDDAQNGATPASLEVKVKKLAQLRAEATMIHLKCIYNTRKILTDDQLLTLAE